MALAIIGSGTITTTAAEQTLVTDTTGKTYVLVVDTALMVNGDSLELRLFTKALTAGTERLAYYAVYQHIQGVPMKYSPPVPADISFRASIKAPAGAFHAFPWKILSL